MDKEIDVKLFVTCRLCIEEVGQYQILPNVQEQFKYCFDIIVESFDGLPQLVCQKCKEILNNFYNLKKLYSNKQADLISKCKKGTYVECKPQHDVVSSSQRTENIEIRKNSPKFSYSSKSNKAVHKSNKKKKKKTIKSQATWDYIGFKKEFVCSICENISQNKRSFIQHKKLHMNFITKHSTIFKKNCSVTLQKIDNKPNVTGLRNAVVHSRNKIIQNCNSLCYIKYSKGVNETVDDNCSESTLTENTQVDLDITDTDDEFIGKFKKPRKRRRLSSRSSGETVIPETNKSISDNDVSKSILRSSNDAQHSQVAEDQCINIEDSSDSDADRCQSQTTCKVKQPVVAKLDDYKTIQGIISMCIKTYNNKMESVGNSASQLKPKVLSIGKKFISKHGSNWTSLLKYMEHKNLNIVWAPKAVSSNTGKDSLYIKFMTKLHGPDPASNLGWTAIDDLSDTGSEQELDTNKVPSPTVQNVKSAQLVLDSAILINCNQPDPKNKLLNASPVANPKRLPRKLLQAKELRKEKSNIIESDLSFCNNEDVNLYMPIITSTTSLAVPSDKEQLQDGSTGPVVTKASVSAPRIKVKPVSELMSESTLNSLRNEMTSGGATSNMIQNQNENLSNILATNSTDHENNLIINPNPMPWTGALSNIYPSNIQTPLIQVPIVSQPMQLVQFVPHTSNYQPVTVTAAPVPLNTTNEDKEEYIILDSVKLPNTKTTSPFQYLRSLFLMHNLFLLEQTDHITREFVCLIKFKVKFHQEAIDNPLILCLSLYCFMNKFCFTVKDKNHTVISINKIKPNWQWEILNIFRGESVEKLLLQNAQKHSKETHEHTNKFICLLNSISRN